MANGCAVSIPAVSLSSSAEDPIPLPDGQMLLTLRNLNRYQKVQRCIVSDTLLANEGCRIGLDTGFVVGPGETDVLDPFCHRSRGRGVFLAHHFAFPLAIGTVVGARVKDEGVASVYLAVAEYQAATNFNVHSIDTNSDQRIETVPDHDRSWTATEKHS
jgi:hypothetical protein